MKHINEEINVWEEVDFSQPGMDLTHLADKLMEDIETSLKRRLIQATIRLRAEEGSDEEEGSDQEAMPDLDQAQLDELMKTVDD